MQDIQPTIEALKSAILHKLGDEVDLIFQYGSHIKGTTHRFSDVDLSLFEMLWGAPQFDVSEEDWAGVQCLCRADSAKFILDIPDYYGFFTYSLFQGTVVKNGASHENKSQKLFRRKR